MIKVLFRVLLVIVIAIAAGVFGLSLVKKDIVNSPEEKNSAVRETKLSIKMKYEKSNNTANRQQTDNNKIEKSDEASVTISFAGDCTLGTTYDKVTNPNSFPYVLKRQKNDYGYFFERVKPVFEKDDLTIVNLETTLTDASERAVKEFCFRGEPSYVNILKKGSIEMVNISNNHIYDYLTAGFNDTLENLRRANILYSGEGHIAYYKVKGVTVASIGFRGWGTYIKTGLKEAIEKAGKKADIVAVSFHGGAEYAFYPDKIQTELGRYSIDCGADIVVGHHPHVIEGIEQYKGKFIVYSLANFCFGGNMGPRERDTFIFQARFKLKNKKIVSSEKEIIPCSISSVKYINNYQPIILKDGEKKRVMNRIFQFSKSLEYGITE